MENIKHFFDTHPDKEQCHATSNGFIFIEKHDAEAHANQLEDSSVETYNRKTIEAFEASADFDEDVFDEDEDSEFPTVDDILNTLSAEDLLELQEKLQAAKVAEPTISFILCVNDSFSKAVPELLKKGIEIGDHVELVIASITKVPAPLISPDNKIEFLEVGANELNPVNDTKDQEGVNITIGDNANAQVQVGSEGAVQTQSTLSTTEKPESAKEPEKPKAATKKEGKPAKA